MNEITIVDKPYSAPIYELLTDGVSKVWFRANSTPSSNWTLNEIMEWADNHGFDFEGYYNERE